MKKFSDFRQFVRDKAHQWGGGNRQELPPQGGNEFPEEELLSAFEQVCRIIEQENILLQNDAPGKAVELLPQKTEAIENLHTLLESVRTLEHKPETLPNTLLDAQKRFEDVINRNGELLEKSLHTQAVVMKILADAATKDAQQSYNQAGLMVTDKSRALGSFNNKI